MNKPGDESARPERRLSMWDCASILIGIIIGSGIYESTSRVAGQLSSTWQLIGVWSAGGLFSLVGAWCYAELASRFPEQGGDYVYLSRAFGRTFGFLFAWTQLWVIRPGSIGAMACVFAAYAVPLQQLWFPQLPTGPQTFLVYACGSIVVLSLVNMAGVPLGARTQNLLTAAKVFGLGALVVVGLLGPAAVADPQADAVTTAAAFPSADRLAFAMIFVLFAYSGWNEIGCVTAEVRNPRRDLHRALLLSAAAVTVIYIGINIACVRVLGLQGMADSSAVATDTILRAVGPGGATALGMLICISALGSTNGMIFTGARIYYAFGQRHRWFHRLASWSPRFGTPLVSLALQGVVTAALVIGFSRSASAGAGRYDFDRLVMFMTPPFYLFLTASAAAVVLFRVLKLGDPDAFRAPWFPLPPLIMALGSLFLTWKGTMYAVSQLNDATWWPAAWVVGTLVSGLVLGLVERIPSPRRGEGGDAVDG